MIDLGAWAEGEYKIPAEPAQEENLRQGGGKYEEDDEN